MQVKRRAIVFLLGVVLQTSTAHAQQSSAAPLVEEFFNAERVAVQDAGDLEFSVGLSSQDGPKWSSRAIIEYGLTPRLQIGAEIPMQRPGDEERDGEKESGAVGWMYALRNDPRKVAVSVGMQAELGPRNGSAALPAIESFAASGFSVGPGSIHGAVSFRRQRGPSWLWNTAAVYPWRQWRGVVEVNRGLPRSNGSMFVTPGIIWKSRNRTELGMGIAVPVGRERRSAGVVVRLTREFDLR